MDKTGRKTTYKRTGRTDGPNYGTCSTHVGFPQIHSIHQILVRDLCIMQVAIREGPASQEWSLESNELHACREQFLSLCSANSLARPFASDCALLE